MLVLLALALVDADEALQGFEELGLMAGGLSYAHLETRLSPSKVRAELEKDKSTFDLYTDKVVNTLEPSSNDDNDTDKAMRDSIITWKKETSKEFVEIIDRAAIWEEIFRPQTDREKRQALVFALGLMGGLTSGFGFSLYSQTKITHLQEMAYANTDAILQLVEATEVSFNRTRHNERILADKIDKIDTTVKKMARMFKVQEYTRTVTDIVRSIVLSYQNWEQGIAGLLQGKASPFLFRPDSLKEQLEILGRKVNEAQHEVLHSPLAELYRFEVSLLATDEHLRVFVHIPIVSCGVLKVYKLQDTPFFDIKENVIYKFHTEKQILAINEDHSRSVAMSLADMNRCRRVTSMYYCDHDLVLNRKPDLTCVGAIFVGNKNKIRERCAINVEKIGDIMQVINRTSVRIFSTKGVIRIHNTCSSQQGLIESGDVIRLAPGCNVFSQDHWFGSTGDVSSAKDVVTSLVTLDEEILPLELHEKGKVKSTLEQLQDEGETMVTFQKIRKKLAEAKKDGTSKVVSVLVTAIAVASFLVVTTVMCYLVMLGSGKSKSWMMCGRGKTTKTTNTEMSRNQREHVEGDYVRIGSEEQDEEMV